jgi:hypothetical protein
MNTNLQQQQRSVQHEQLTPEGLNIAEAIPGVISEGIGLSSEVSTRIRSYGSAPPRKIRDFSQCFYWLYIYTTGSVEEKRLNVKLMLEIRNWFSNMNKGLYRDSEYLLTGCHLFEQFVQHMQMLGIGQLFHETPQAPCFTEDLEMHRILLEDDDPEEYSIEGDDE